MPILEIMPSNYADNSEFAKLIAHRDGDVDLVRLMLEFAGDAYRDLNPHAALAELDDLGQQARETTADPGTGIAARLESVSELLYDREGFRGNQDSYYDPRNSYLNEVLSRRVGIPISLAIVYITVGRQAGLDVFGVGTPGHFVVGCHTEGNTLYVDPFTDGAVLDEYACRERIHRVLGQNDVLTSDHFRPATPREIAARVLRNLKAAHAMRDAWPDALPVQLRLTALLPDVLDERRDLGLIYLRNSDPHPAVALLEEYVRASGSEPAEAVMPFLKSARRMAAERN
jgi:regulator of sirC expression with transglutaminase-like and TPR domain